jgi:RimJ/RimL family protein N-acetyltransferase
MNKINPQARRLKSGALVMVRDAVLSDAQSIVDIMRAVVSEGQYTLAEPDELEWTEESKRQELIEFQHKPGCLILVAEVDGDVVGFVDFENGSRRRTAHSGMLSIFVDQAWREQGVGSCLLHGLLDWARANPLIVKVTLAVFSTNARAIAVYQKLGFQIEGRCPRDMKIGDDYVDSVLMYQFVK